MLIWGASLGFSLLFPVIYVLLGILLFAAEVPKKINWWAGYRTSMSYKNSDTWRFANTCFGKGLLYTGITLLVIALVAHIAVRGSGGVVIVIVGATAFFISVVAIMIPIILTELALRKNFDKNGERRK